MIPLPYFIDTSLAQPLQFLATEASTYVLQTLGLPALSEGNIIIINEHQIGIVEACSGLRMLMVFFALSTGMALVIRAPLGDKLFLVASSVPIALAVNVVRITATGVLTETTSSQVAHVFYHDVAGYAMPVMALGLLWLEWKVLARLLVPAPHTVRPPARAQTPPAAPPRRLRTVRAAVSATPTPRPARPARPARRPASAPPAAQEPATQEQPDVDPAHRASA